jgi:two-component sensor histidine kinase
MIRTDGINFIVHWNMIFLFDPDGKKIMATIAQGRDMTEFRHTEKMLDISEGLYRSLFENMFNGFVYCKMVYDEKDSPLDFIYIAVNKAFSRLTGLNGVVGKYVSEIIPGIRNSDYELLEIYGRVAKTGQSEQFEYFLSALNQWFLISVYSHETDFFVSVFDIITEKKLAEERTIAALREKETMLREIHHRVKNNLQIISSLLRLQARSSSGTVTGKIFNECQDRIAAMAAIHSLLYKSKDLSKIDFNEYIRQTSGQLIRSYKKISTPVVCTITGSGICLGIDTAIPLGLIVNELFTNALKYAFTESDKGEIRINLELEGEEIVLIVEDNGKGIPNPSDLLTTESFGMKLVNMLVIQLDGSLKLISENGCRFIIRFRMKNNQEANHVQT